MKHRKQSNPGGSEVIWLVALAGAAYIAYEYVLKPNAATSTVVAAAAPVATGTPTTAPANTPVVTPALGTTITSATQAALQSGANYPYIIPDAPTAASLMSTGLNGYSPINTTDAGTIFLRADIATALLTLLNARNARSAGAALTSVQQATNVTLASIQQMMQNQGLHGLGLMGLYPAYGMRFWN